MTPTLRDSTPASQDAAEWDLSMERSDRSGRFGPLRLGPLSPVDAALLELLLAKRTVDRTEIRGLLGRPVNDDAVEGAVNSLRLRLPILAAARIVRVGAWGFRYRRPVATSGGGMMKNTLNLLLAATVVTTALLDVAFASGPEWPPQMPQFERLVECCKRPLTTIVPAETALAAESVDISLLEKFEGREVTVVGVVFKARMARRGDAITLDFHPDWRSHLSVVVPRELIPDFPAWKSLEGRRIEVRGVLSRFQGQVGRNLLDKPEITISSLEQIKVLGPARPPDLGDGA